MLGFHGSRRAGAKRLGLLVATAVGALMLGPAVPASATPAAQNGQGCTVLGTLADDLPVVRHARNVVCGLAGNDTIVGGGGDEVIDGGADLTLRLTSARLVSGTATNGVWDLTGTVPAYTPAGDWQVSTLALTDRVGHVRTLRPGVAVTPLRITGISHRTAATTYWSASSSSRAPAASRVTNCS